MKHKEAKQTPGRKLKSYFHIHYSLPQPQRTNRSQPNRTQVSLTGVVVLPPGRSLPTAKQELHMYVVNSTTVTATLRDKQLDPSSGSSKRKRTSTHQQLPDYVWFASNLAFVPLTTSNLLPDDPFQWVETSAFYPVCLPFCSHHMREDHSHH